ncbi:hypothetical protein Tco_0602944, partial [Tanacetum coccineum]
KKDSEIVKAKVQRKYLTLKAKKESSDEECLLEVLGAIVVKKMMKRSKTRHVL